jgi:hypothetical protein
MYCIFLFFIYIFVLNYYFYNQVMNIMKILMKIIMLVILPSFFIGCIIAAPVISRFVDSSPIHDSYSRTMPVTELKSSVLTTDSCDQGQIYLENNPDMDNCLSTKSIIICIP